jgi:diguanylate cyclase (GGDEF)-like protein
MSSLDLTDETLGLFPGDADPHARIAEIVRESLPEQVAAALLGRIADVLESLVPRDWEILALENAALRQELDQLASSDPLTGLRNRRQFFDDLNREFSAARRYNDTLSLVLIDLDDLGQLNDTRGFEAGDELLQRVGEMLLTRLRVTDIAARIGGDSFAAILPRTPAEGVKALSKRLSREIGARVAIGYATIDDTLTSGAALLERADQSLAAERGLLQKSVRARARADD